MSTTVSITGEMTFDCHQMIREAVGIRAETIEKITAECDKVDPGTYDWSLVDRDTWFACLNKSRDGSNGKAYWFPMCESENKEKNYKRAKEGMAYFKSKGWEVYKIQ
tara:strand:- start:220 stop:540 length:321 start_codon:yes stop_codon:yes gene_type:complete